MPRRSPRSRRKPERGPGIPGPERPRATPRRRRVKSRAATRAVQATGGAGRRAKRRHARFTPPDAARVTALLGILERLYPDAQSALHFGNPLQLLIATILSAQCTDERVNQVTPALFERYPDAAAFAAAKPADLEAMIHSTGFFRNKARAIRECCADIVAHHGGQVPRTLDELTKLRGVGRKTANVVLGNAYGIPGLVVDTHVTRLSYRLGLTKHEDAAKIELDLMEVVPQDDWTLFSHLLIFHGRAICQARNPKCEQCPIREYCPSATIFIKARQTKQKTGQK